MKNIIHIFLIFSSSIILAQEFKSELHYTESALHPFGKYNPSAPEQVLDFDSLIGVCDCKSIRRNYDGTWQDTLSMVWKFKYILNGTAVQDETWLENGITATSIRQFHPDSSYWLVSYYSSFGIRNNVSIWRGNKIDGDIVLEMPQKAPNGMDGINSLTFFNISSDGFDWKGEWLNPERTITYPFWNIICKKRN